MSSVKQQLIVTGVLALALTLLLLFRFSGALARYLSSSSSSNSSSSSSRDDDDDDADDYFGGNRSSSSSSSLPPLTLVCPGCKSGGGGSMTTHPPPIKSVNTPLLASTKPTKADIRLYRGLSLVRYFTSKKEGEDDVADSDRVRALYDLPKQFNSMTQRELTSARNRLTFFVPG
jgi:hypothetical protein